MINSEAILNARILIVDDKQANVRLLERILSVAGYANVDTTNDPTLVCDLHRKNHYGLILLDLQMPGMDGFRVMKDLKSNEPDDYLPVLVMTANPDQKLRALEAGARDFLSTPYEMAEVLLRIRNMLEVRLLHEAAGKYARKLEALALNDPLTGLANRRLLDDRMLIALEHARRNKSALAVIYIDLDGFKAINDSLGHGTGDLLLKSVASRLRAAVRKGDTVTRLGGDEFAVLLWHVRSPEDASAAASKIIRSLSQPCVFDGHEVQVTASAGIAIYPFHGGDGEALMSSADLALYGAKHQGKNTCCMSVAVNPTKPAT